jgi:hypothetical protein
MIMRYLLQERITNKVLDWHGNLVSFIVLIKYGTILKRIHLKRAPILYNKDNH